MSRLMSGAIPLPICRHDVDRVNNYFTLSALCIVNRDTRPLLCSLSNIIYTFKFLTSFGMGAMSVGYVDDDDDLLKFNL